MITTINEFKKHLNENSNIIDQELKKLIDSLGSTEYQIIDGKKIGTYEVWPVKFGNNNVSSILVKQHLKELKSLEFVGKARRTMYAFDVVIIKPK